MCYLVLIITANFTPYWRRAVFLVLLTWSAYWGDLMAEIPFYIGALMADMSIVLSQKGNTVSTTSSRNIERLQKYWPVTLGIISLVLCSYPPNWAELSPWSHAMMRLANRFFHSNCTISTFRWIMLTDRGTQMGLLSHRLRRPDLLTPPLAHPAPTVLPKLRRLFRQYFLPRLPPPLTSHALRPCMDCLRDHSRGTVAASVYLHDMCVCRVFCLGDVFECVVEGYY